MNNIIKSTIAAGTIMALNVSHVFAAGALAPSKGFESIANITPNGLVSTAVRLLLVVASIVFFFMLVIGGIKWILSGGDKGKTEEARNQITAALVGLVIVFSAWAIAQLVKATFGVDILNLDLNANLGIQ